MPRKIRCLSLALSLVVAAGLADQAAQAAPLPSRAGVTEASAGGYLAAAWGWFTTKIAGWGQLASAQFRQLPGVWEKDGGAADPNNNPPAGSGSGGTGSKSSLVIPIGSIAP